MDYTKVIVTVLEKVKVIYWPLLIFSTIVLFSPDEWMDKLSLTNTLNEYKVQISLVFLITLSFAIVDIFIFLKSFFTDKANEKKIKNMIKKNLRNTSATQRYIIHNMYAPDTPSGMNLNISNPEVSDLVTKRIIYRTSTLGQLTSFAHSLTPIAKEILDSNPKILKEIIEVYQSDDVDVRAIGRSR